MYLAYTLIESSREDWGRVPVCQASSCCRACSSLLCHFWLTSAALALFHRWRGETVPACILSPLVEGVAYTHADTGVSCVNALTTPPASGARMMLRFVYDVSTFHAVQRVKKKKKEGKKLQQSANDLLVTHAERRCLCASMRATGYESMKVDCARTFFFSLSSLSFGGL